MAVNETTNLNLTVGSHAFPGNNEYTFTRADDGDAPVFLSAGGNVPVKLKFNEEFSVSADKAGEHTVICTESCRVTVHRIEPEDATAGTGPAFVEESPADAPVSSGGVVRKPFRVDDPDA